MAASNNQLNCVVLIDDDDINNFVNERLISSLHITNTIITLRNGKEGIEFLKKFYRENSFLPDLIFLDVNMPLMDGFEFMEEFNKSGLMARTVIAVLTTSTNSRDIDRLKELGIKYIMHKPLAKERVMDLLKKESFV